MQSSSGSAHKSRPSVQHTFNSLSTMSKGSALTIPLVQTLHMNAAAAVAVATDVTSMQLEAPLQSFQTHSYIDGNDQSKIQPPIQAISFSNIISLPKPAMSGSVEVTQPVSSGLGGVTSSSLPSIVPLNAINLSVVKVPIVDFDVSSKTGYNISIASAEKNDGFDNDFNERLFSSNHFGADNNGSNLTSLCNSSNFEGSSADNFANMKLNANPGIFATASNRSNISVLASAPLAPRVVNKPTNPRRYRAIRPLIRSTCEETKNGLHFNEKLEENQIQYLSQDKSWSPTQSSLMSRSDTPALDFCKDNSGCDVNPFISVVNHPIDSVDSHIESAVITVNESDLSYASERNSNEEMQFNSANDIRDFVIENSIDSFQMRGVDNGLQELQFTEYFGRSVASSLIKKTKDSGLCLESYSLGPESYVSYETTKDAFGAVPTYPHFLCVVCGKSEVVSQQKSLQNASVGQDQVLVVKILTKLLNTTSSKLYEKGEKICLHCMNTLHEIEILKERVQNKEKLVRELYANSSSWINKLEKEESYDDEFMDNDFSENRIPRSETGVSIGLDQEYSSDLLINVENISYNSQKCVFPSTEVATLDSEMDTSAKEQSAPSRRRKQFRCLKCHTSFSNMDDRKVHMRRCRRGQVKHFGSRDNLRRSSGAKEPTALSANKKESSGLKKKNRGLNNYTCDECYKTFPSRNSLANHVSSHQTSFDCHVCFRYLTTKARLEAHLFKFHGIGEGKSKSVQCNLCDKAFQTKAGLCYHKNVAHQIGTKYVCEHCQKVYYYHVPYRSHMLFAHGKKKIVCETCGAMFFTVSKLNTHINAVHRNAETWQCLKCNVKFTTSTAFRQHNLVKHHNTKHGCDYCPAQFRKVSSLHSHLKEHSVYLCKACQLTFVDEQLYNSHMLETHNKPILKPVKRRSYTSKKVRVKAETSNRTFGRFTKTDTVDVANEVHQINLNDILLSNSFSNSSNLQVLSNINLGESSGKISTFNLVNSDTGLDMPSNGNTLPLTDDVTVINVGILNNIEISDSRTELYAVNSLDNHQNFDTESLSDMANLEANLSSNLPHSVTPFGADSGVGNSDDATGVIQLVKTAVGSLQASAPDLQSSVSPLDHTALQANVHDLEATVNELSPPTADIEQSEDLSPSVVDIDPSVHHLDHSDKTEDPANLWMKDNAWAILKSGNNDENLSHLQNLPSSGIEDLDIGVIGGDIDDTNVITDADTIDLDIHVPNAETTDPRLVNIDVDIT